MAGKRVRFTTATALVTQRYWDSGESVIKDFHQYTGQGHYIADHGFFILLNRLQAEFSDIRETTNNFKKRSDYIVDAITSELNQSLHIVANIDSICHQHEISPAYLNKCFRQRFGVSVTRYHMMKRIHYACELLEQSTLPLKAIARETGFYDYHHFNKKMRQFLGMNPSKYRKLHFQNAADTDMLPGTKSGCFPPSHRFGN